MPAFSLKTLRGHHAETEIDLSTDRGQTQGQNDAAEGGLFIEDHCKTYLRNYENLSV